MLGEKEESDDVQDEEWRYVKHVQGQKGEKMMGCVESVQRPELKKQKQVPGHGWGRLG